MKRSATCLGIAIFGPSALQCTLAFSPDWHTSSSVRRATAVRNLSNRKGKGASQDFDSELNHQYVVADESRRNLLAALPFAMCISARPKPALANLMQFPCEEGTLMNTYHFMRAGESLLEEDDIVGSNPLFLTNRENALSERGLQQVLQACDGMVGRDLNPSVVLYSLAANSIDTANTVATEMKIGRNRVMPEYTNLDARGLGKWDMNARSAVEPAVWAMDAMEAGAEGRNGRPPPNDDGTPNETLYNQVTRLRQLMSVCETNFSGDSVLLIFPDGTGPALLSCLVAGVPLSRVHELQYEPGEVRYDVNMKSTLALLGAGPSQSYLETIEQGKAQLKSLRDNPDLVINMKDKRINEDMQAAEEARLMKEEVVKQRKLAEQEEKQALEKERIVKLEADRQTRMETFGNLPDFASIAALGLVASMAAVGTRQVAGEEKDMSTDYPSSDGDKIWEGKKPLDPSKGDSEAVAAEDAPPSSIAPELKIMEDLVQNAPIDVPEFSSVKPFQDALEEELWNARSEQSEKDRKQLAEVAMEEYMNKDDGGDAWLDMVSSLMDDDE